MHSSTARAVFCIALFGCFLMSSCSEKHGIGAGTTNGATAAAAPATQPAPPIAPRIPRQITQQGETRTDDYFWLREKENPEVIKYLQAENAYTAAVLKPAEPLKQKLYNEILARIKEDDTEVPWRKSRWVYYSKTQKGKQYPIHCRKLNADSSPAADVEDVILDVNALAQGKQFMDVGDEQVSDDANLLAFTTDETGFREYTLRVKDLRTNQLLPEAIPHVDAVVWAADNKTLFYVIEDDAKRPYRLYRHVLGTPRERDDLVFEETDRLYDLAVGRTRSGAYIVVTSASKEESEVRVISTARPTERPRLVAPRRHLHEYYLDHWGDHLLIRTNDQGKNFRLATAPVADPSPPNWKTLIPHRDDVMLENVEPFQDAVALFERADALPRIVLLDPRTGATKPVKFPEPVYSVSPGRNEEYSLPAVRIAYQSFLTPASTYDCNLKTGALTLLKRKEVLGGYDPTKYTSQRIYATAPDGTKIPISMVWRTDAPAAGPKPLLLEGYGAYGFPQQVFFDSTKLSLLDRGMVFALAHPRGGGDYGKRWHDDGRMLHKTNTFTDFIACADHLVKSGYTTRDQLAITGASAGGLLIGAVLNLRPDLCKAVLLEVPFVDVLNTMSDDTLPLTTQEYIEWGNPANKTEFDFIKTYCPYTNIHAAAYPAMLVRTSLNDSQVLYHEPAKYVAKMRATRTDHHTLLLYVNMGAGHGGASGRYDALKETAFEYTFLLRELGIEQ
jgi:oligopeptidase B